MTNPHDQFSEKNKFPPSRSAINASQLQKFYCFMMVYNTVRFYKTSEIKENMVAVQKLPVNPCQYLECIGNIRKRLQKSF